MAGGDAVVGWDFKVKGSAGKMLSQRCGQLDVTLGNLGRGDKDT